MANELVSIPVDVLVTVASPAAIVAKQVRTNIPIVFMLVNDPVGQGLVSSLARPGGNVTGLSTLTGSLSGKRVEIFRETLPRLSRLGVLCNTTNSGMALALSQTLEAAQSFGIRAEGLGVRPADDLSGALEEATACHMDGIIVLATISVAVVDVARRYRMPAMYSDRNWVDLGGLMGVGPNLASIRYRAASYVDRILHGTPPGELPVEQPSAFEFVINLPTARDLGLEIPESVMQQATDVLR